MASGSVTKVTTEDGVRWRVRVNVYDPVTGKRHQPQRSYKTKRAAETALAHWVVELERGTAVDRSLQTVGSYLEEWLETSVRHRVRPTTLASYQYLVYHYITPALGGIVLQKLTPQQLQSFYAAQMTAGRPGRVRADKASGLSPTTVRYIHRVLHEGLKDALRLGLVARNVTDAVTPPKPVHHDARAWSIDEVQRFLAVARGDRLWPLWLLALHTGLRRGELLGLRWRDFDLENRMLVVRQEVVPLNGHVEVLEGAKSGGHMLALDDTCVEELRKYRTTQLEHRLGLGALWQDHDLVVTQDDGTPVAPHTVNYRFGKLIGKAGVTRLPLHGLRHTHATILMVIGVHPKLVSERLGHADITMTLRTYSHVLPVMHQQAADAFAAAIAIRNEDLRHPQA